MNNPDVSGEGRCFPLQLDFEIIEESGAVTPIDPINLPSFVESFLQDAASAEYDYTVTFKISDDSEVKSYTLRNRVTNSAGLVRLATNPWHVHFFTAIIGQVYEPDKNPPENAVFKFAKQQTAPIQVKTFYNYNTMNTAVTLTSYFGNYDLTAGLYSVSKDASGQSETITLDRTLWPNTTVYSGSVTRYTVPNLGAANSPGPLLPLQLSLTI